MPTSLIIGDSLMAKEAESTAVISDCCETSIGRITSRRDDTLWQMNKGESQDGVREIAGCKNPAEMSQRGREAKAYDCQRL